jgi:hypothetical protein
MLASLNEDRWHVTCSQWFSSSLKRISPSGSDRMISQKASSWDRGFSFALQLDSATRARTHFKVASADLQPRANGLHEKMGKDGDGALSLDRALQQIEFVQQC